MNKIKIFIKNCFSCFKAGLKANFIELKKFFSNKHIKRFILVGLFSFFFSIGSCIGADNVKNSNSSLSVEFAEPTALTDRQQIDNSNDRFFNDTLIGSFIDLGSCVIPSQSGDPEDYYVSCGSFYLFNFNNNYPSDYASELNTEIYDDFGLLYPYALDGNTIDYHFMLLERDFGSGNTYFFKSGSGTYNIAFYNATYPSNTPLHINIPISVQLSFKLDYLDPDNDGRFENILDNFSGCESRIDYSFNDLTNLWNVYTTKKLRSNNLQNLCQVRIDYKNYGVLGNTGFYYENLLPVFSINLNGLRQGIYDRGYDYGYDIGKWDGENLQVTSFDAIFISIQKGLSNFFDIRLFGSFTIGHIFLLMFGVMLIYIFIRQFLT